MNQQVIDDLKAHIESVVTNVSLFEFNNDKTRENFRASLFPYLSNLAQDGYIIEHVCDETNNTNDVINNNEFNSDIYLKKDGKWRILSVTVVCSGTTFYDVEPIE